MKKEVGIVPMVFLTNKSDLRKDTGFDFKQVEDLAEQYDSTIIKTSAKTGENVENAFLELGRKMANMILDEK